MNAITSGNEPVVRNIMFVYPEINIIDGTKKKELVSLLDSLKYRVRRANDIMRVSLSSDSFEAVPQVIFDRIDYDRDIPWDDNNAKAIRICLTELCGTDLVTDVYPIMENWDFKELDITHLIAVNVSKGDGHRVTWSPSSHAIFNVQAETTFEGVTDLVLSVLCETTMYYSLGYGGGRDNYDFRRILSSEKIKYLIKKFAPDELEEYYGYSVDVLGNTGYLPMAYAFMRKNKARTDKSNTPETFWNEFETKFSEILQLLSHP